MFVHRFRRCNGEGGIDGGGFSAGQDLSLKDFSLRSK
jgi:hypothetical protein